MLIGLLTAALILTCVLLLVLIIGLQHGNEGGVSSAFGGGNAQGVFGASGGVTLIVRMTWICIFVFFGLTLTLGWLKTHEKFGVGRELNSLLDEPVPAASAVPPAGASPSASAQPAVPPAGASPAGAPAKK